jgi:protoporphyrin/coproporphyrin ferrochelatase
MRDDIAQGLAVADIEKQQNMPRRVGILLVNLGTPEGTDFSSVRRYLKEFLSDRRVVETPKILWWPILNLFILSTRPARSGKAYARIWNRQENESPLKTITRAQAEALARWVASGGLVPKDRAQEIAVDWGMRYGRPSIRAGLENLIAKGCDRIAVLPLYPQYAAATTATVGDAVFADLAKRRFQPALRIAAPYYDAPLYIEALATSVRERLAALTFAPDVILVSFHGIPRDYADKGDPYPRQCETTFHLLEKALALPAGMVRMSYQSRFGPSEWLQPYTDETIVALANQGVKNLLVIAPGFSADCLETLDEMGNENRHLFLENGGENYALVPCLNASAEGMRLIQDLVRRETSGWL